MQNEKIKYVKEKINDANWSISYHEKHLENSKIDLELYEKQLELLNNEE